MPVGCEYVVAEGGNHRGFASYSWQPLDWEVGREGVEGGRGEVEGGEGVATYAIQMGNRCIYPGHITGR